MHSPPTHAEKELIRDDQHRDQQQPSDGESAAGEEHQQWEDVEEKQHVVPAADDFADRMERELCAAAFERDEDQSQDDDRLGVRPREYLSLGFGVVEDGRLFDHQKLSRGTAMPNAQP